MLDFLRLQAADPQAPTIQGSLDWLTSRSTDDSQPMAAFMPRPVDLIYSRPFPIAWLGAILPQYNAWDFGNASKQPFGPWIGKRAARGTKPHQLADWYPDMKKRW